MRKVSLVIGLVFVAMCVVMFAGGMFMPRALAFLDPVLCPGGGQLGNHSEDVTDSEGTRTSTTLVCLQPNGQVQDATGKSLVILGGLAVLGGLFLVLSMPFSVVKPAPAAPPAGGPPAG
jgi:hypothetical protein